MEIVSLTEYTSGESAADLSTEPATPDDSPFLCSCQNDPVFDNLLPMLSNLYPSDKSSDAQAKSKRLPGTLDQATEAGLIIREICFIGAGYVGAPTAAIIAFKNPSIRITVIDREELRIRRWNSAHLPIREPGLRNIVRIARDGLRNENKIIGRQPNLVFSTDSGKSIAKADMIFIAVNTPTKSTGLGAGHAADLTALESAVNEIAAHAKDGAILVEKSTVPCRTARRIQDILHSLRPGARFEVLSSPEFLSEGTAVENLMHPDRVIIGSSNTNHGHCAAVALAKVYAPWVPPSNILCTNIWSAELSKLVANAMLAQRISSINSITAICEGTGADVQEVARSIGLDLRIGPQFLKAGLGFGGSCFKKDIGSLVYLAKSLGLHEVGDYWSQVLTINDLQRSRFARKVISRLNGTLVGKKITLLGFAFKKNTADTRESVAIEIIRILLEEVPAEIAIFDPWCSAANIQGELDRHFALIDSDLSRLRNAITVCTDPYQACHDANAILIVTDWDEFRMAPSTMAPDSYKNLQVRNGVTSIPLELGERYLPEPPCPPNCPDCINSFSGSDSHQDFEWARISYHMKEPKWVFDGRGVVDVAEMGRLGIMVEVLGKPEGGSCFF